MEEGHDGQERLERETQRDSEGPRSPAPTQTTGDFISEAEADDAQPSTYAVEDEDEDGVESEAEEADAESEAADPRPQSSARFTLPVSSTGVRHASPRAQSPTRPCVM